MHVGEDTQHLSRGVPWMLCRAVGFRGVFALLTPSLQGAEFHVSSPLSLSGPGLFASPEGFAASRTEALRDRGGVGGIDQRKHQPSDRGNKLQPVKRVDST